MKSELRAGVSAGVGILDLADAGGNKDVDNNSNRQHLQKLTLWFVCCFLFGFLFFVFFV